MTYRSLPLRTRFIVATVAMIVLLTGVYTAVALHRVRSAHLDEMEKRGLAIAKELSQRAEFPMRVGDEDALTKMAAEVLIREDVIGVSFKEAGGNDILTLDRKPDEGCSKLEYSSQITVGEDSFDDELGLLATEPMGPGTPVELGSVTVVLSTASVNQVTSRIGWSMAAAASILCALAIVFAIVFARRITGPINRLSEAVEKIESGHMDVEIEEFDEGEIGALASHFNRMSRNLRHLLDQMVQQEKMAGLGRMAAGITHEIGSPLNSILLDAGMLVNETNDPAQKESAKAILKQARRMRDTVRNLLDYSRVPADGEAKVDVSAAFDEAVHVLAHPIRKCRLEIREDFPEDLPPVRGVRNMIIQVFINLITNTVEAVCEDGVLKVDARVSESGNRVIMRFVDDGPGIRGEVLGSIFEPFFTTKPEGEGTGLGLAISYQIMTGMGGDISARSPEGGGAEFMMEFQAFKDEEDI